MKPKMMVLALLVSMTLMPPMCAQAADVLAPDAKSASPVNGGEQPTTDATRASKMLGSKVVNDANETVGTIDDLLIRSDGDNRVLYAVVSVGGFLGMGDKQVVVPYRMLAVSNEKVVLSDATAENIKRLPEFEYRKP